MSNCHIFAMSSRTTVLNVLEQLVATHPDWFVVLDSAKRSAHKCSFRRPRDVAALLAKLINYRRVMMQYGDSEARKVFGKNEYAAHESSTTRNNKIARANRTFVYNGKATLMEQHLKNGVKDSEAETLRVYFTWCSASRRIVIGHCGAHLPLR